MFEFVRRHNRLLQFALVLLIFPSFIVFGIQGYQRFANDSAAVAEVAGKDVTQQELDAAHRQQVERLRLQMPQIDVKVFDTPEVKRRVLEDIVRERVLLEAARKLNLAPTDEQLLRSFQSDPQFASLRNPDGSVRRELLAARGLSSEQFAQQLKQDFAMRQVLSGIGATQVAALAPAQVALDALYQQRDVRVARFDPKDYRAAVEVTPADVQAYYDDPAHASGLQAPESVSVEYVMLDLAALKRTLVVPEAELRKYYAENVARYSTPEERRVRHILLKAEQGADAATKAQAKAKAQEVLATLEKDRSRFAELAKKSSQDPGSAAQGGELDWFGKGAMTKPFEDVAFALKKGELSGLVETDFGFHILEVQDVRGGTARSFEAVRAQLEDEVKQQLVQKRYSEMAEQFTDAVDQEDGLKAVADKFKLELGRAEQLTRAGTGAPGSPLMNPRLLEALFQPDSLQKKRNLSAIEIGANQLASARVLAWSPARKLALADVTGRIRGLLIDQRARDAARKDGQALLARWQAHPLEAEPRLGAMQSVSRAKAQTYGRELVDGVLRMPAGKLPAWAGVDLGSQGYAVVRLDAVHAADVAAVGGAERMREQYAQLWAQAEAEAYYAALKDRFKVKIKPLSTTPAESSATPQ